MHACILYAACPRIEYMLAGGASYIFGAVLYGARLPERLLAGRCDLWGQSHQVPGVPGCRGCHGAGGAMVPGCHGAGGAMVPGCRGCY
jgi:hypothetical protein